MSEANATPTTDPTPLAALLHATVAIKSTDPAERAEALQRLRSDGWPVADGLLSTLEKALDGMTTSLSVTLTSDEISGLAAPLAIARTILGALEHGESNARLQAGLASSAPA